MAELEGFRCHTCGKWHEGLPLDYAYDAPYYWSESLRADADSFLNSDLCTIKKKDFFVRGLIEVPVIGHDEPFRWGVWTSLSKSNFDRMVDLWHDPKLLDEPPYFGWLSNSIDLYPDTLNLKANVYSKNIGPAPISSFGTDGPSSSNRTTRRNHDRARARDCRALVASRLSFSDFLRFCSKDLLTMNSC